VWQFPVAMNALVRQPHATVFNIFDQDTITFLEDEGVQFTLGEYLQAGSKLIDFSKSLEKGEKKGQVFIGDSLGELAQKLKMDINIFRETVYEYNACCEKNHDFIFAKSRKYLHTIKKPRYYAVKICSVLLITEGGIKINHRMEAIDDEFKTIPGLYAGGCAAGGLVGDSYIMVTSGGSLSFAVNSGRIAGENILKYMAI
jgi:fumarate reductase flavoprotein subunit